MKTLDRETLAEMLGLTRESSGVMDAFSTIGIFAAGIMLGAALGLLFAPRPGEELREELGERMGGLRDQVSHAARDAASMAQS